MRGALPFIEAEPTPMPSAITILSGDGQTALAGAQLPQPVTVLVTDPQGAGIVGAQVAFRPDTLYPGVEDFSFNSDTVFTDSSGRASSTWTLTSAGEDNVATITVVGTGDDTRRSRSSQH